MSDLNSETTLNALLDAAVESIIQINKRGIIQLVNKATLQLFGYSANELIGQSINMLMPASEAQQHDHYLSQYQKTGKKSIIGIGRKVKGLTKDQTTIPVALSVGEIIIEGKNQGYIGILRDLREEQALEEALKYQANTLAEASRINSLGELAAGIAHELNQPLAALTNYSQALKRLYLQSHQNKTQQQATPAEKTLEKLLENIEQQALRASEILARQRNFSRKAPFEIQTISLHQLIRETLTFIDADPRFTKANIQTIHGELNPQLRLDPIQIQQVLLNLFRNALDATESLQSPEIILQVKKSSAYNTICIEIHDNGSGVPEAIKATLFHPFQSTKDHGIGIGLCISESILKAHGSSLAYKSSPILKGACFYFILSYEPKSSLE